MRRLLALTCIFVVATAASASAAHFDVIPAGTISVSNTSGQPLGSLVNDNLGWGDCVVGTKTFNMDNVKLARVEGEVTDVTGGRGLGTGGNWSGTWGTIGITDYGWIDGAYLTDDHIPSPASYKVGWIQNQSMVIYTAGAGSFEDYGTKLGWEDTRSVSGHWKDMSHTFSDNAWQFILDWDLTNYDPANKAAGGIATWMDTLDSADPGAGWWSEQNGTAHPDADGLESGIMHGNWDPSEAGYYDTYTDAVLTIALVEDEIGLGGSFTYTDVTLDVVGKVPGDVNLDGFVTQADLDIANANLGSNDAHWGMGDVTGGNVLDWGGLDGAVDAQDIALITNMLTGGIEGDLNLDGSVNSSDLDLVRANWGRTDASSTLDGDATGDGYVNSSDLDVIRANWGNTAPTAVPEPGFLMLAAAGLLALALRRK